MKKNLIILLIKLRTWWKEILSVILSAFRGMGRDNISMVASGMVYSTLIAIIPCLTFLVAFLSAFGVAQPFMDMITTFLTEALGEAMGLEVNNYIRQFSTNAMSLGVAGLVSFIITGILLVDKIYISVNSIFRTRPSSGAVRRFSTFLTFIIVGAFLIVATYALKSMVQNAISRILIGFTRPRGNFMSSFVPCFVIWAFLFMLYKAVPSAKIKATSAASGAFVGFILLFFATKIFNCVTQFMVSYSVIYGSLASLLIALLYLYVSWFIILFSAEVVYVHQFRPDKTLLMGHIQAPAMQISEAVNMLLLIADKYRRGGGAMTLKELMRRLGVPSATINSYLCDFEDAHMILSTNTSRTAFVPARPLDQIYLKGVIQVLYGGGHAAEAERIETIGEAVALDFLKSGTADLETISVENLLERI